MINSELFDLFTQDNIDKQAKIEYSGGVMTNEELFQNSEQLTESLCSGNELRFGCCEASCFKFKVANIMKPLMGERIKFSIVVGHREGSPLVIGTYKVQSDTLTADRRQREVVAYDAMYDILKADVTAWYNNVLPNKDSAVTMSQFRKNFVSYFDLEEIVPEGGLVNDNMTIERTIDPEQISGLDVITAICEINGCFGHIGRDEKFHYIYFPQAIEGLYPANDLYPDHAPEYMAQAVTGHLYPQTPKGIKIDTALRTEPPKYESFTTKPITKLQIRKEENDIGAVWPEGDIEEKDNCYIIQDNFLVYGKSHEELQKIAKNIYSKITNIVYRPYSAKCVGNPCLEVGDPIRMSTKYDIIESYILKRTMKGIQALRDTYEASGVKKYGEKVNGVQKSIIELKGKTNTLTRTVEENRLEVKDIERNLQSEILQNASEIALRVRKDNVIASINLSPETITLQAQKIDLQGLVNADELVSKFATITTLNATKANLESVIATKATITDLSATNARVGALETDRITASEVAASYATITSLNAVNAKFNNLNASNIKSGTLSADRIDANSLSIGASQITGTIGLWIPYDFYSTTITYVDGSGVTHTQTVLTGISEKRRANVVSVG